MLKLFCSPNKKYILECEWFNSQNYRCYEFKIKINVHHMVNLHFTLLFWLYLFIYYWSFQSPIIKVNRKVSFQNTLTGIFHAHVSILDAHDMTWNYSWCMHHESWQVQYRSKKLPSKLNRSILKLMISLNFDVFFLSWLGLSNDVKSLSLWILN